MGGAARCLPKGEVSGGVALKFRQPEIPGGRRMLPRLPLAFPHTSDRTLYNCILPLQELRRKFFDVRRGIRSQPFNFISWDAEAVLAAQS